MLSLVPDEDHGWYVNTYHLSLLSLMETLGPAVV